MDCLQIPKTIEEANDIIVECSGFTNWVPLFIEGLQAAVLLVAIIIIVIYCISRIGKNNDG